MNSKLVAVGILALGVCLVLVVVAIALMSRGESSPPAADDPYAGLPTSPPVLPIVAPATDAFGMGLQKFAQDIVNHIFNTRSTCYHANRWVRVTVMNLMLQHANEQHALYRRITQANLGRAEREKEIKKGMEALRATVTKRMAESMKELEKCHPDTVLFTPADPATRTSETSITVGAILSDRDAYARRF